MAVVQNPLIGSAKNKIGGTVFQKWKNKNVLRTKPLTVANPNTLAQQKQRLKMTTVVAIMREIQATLKEAFNEVIAGITAPNAFVSANMQAVSVNDSLVVTVTTANMVFAKGTIAPILGDTVASTVANAFQVTWTDNSNGSTALATDVLRLALIRSDGSIARVYQTTATRADEDSGAIDITDNYAQGEDVSVFAYFVRPSVNKESDSVFVDTVTITA